MNPNADHKHVISYVVRQKTTTPNTRKTIEAFENELKLQYGGTVTVESVVVEDGRPPQLESFEDVTGWRAEYVEPERTVVRHTGGHYDQTRPSADLHSELGGRRTGW